MASLRNVYAEKALTQIPRLLSAQDRNRFSPSYGCMNREFWLCRTTDFPSSIAQFGVHALALAYAHDMPGNVYYKQQKILDWALAGVDYWTRIQHRDGSFDEFYPNERGWAGPTGFLLYAMCDTYRLLEDRFPAALKERFLKAAHRAALFLAKTDESGVLANHHAMAVLPMYEAYSLIGDRRIEEAFKEKLDTFFGYCHDEGWCLEYDGADPGYLSATVSFIAKLRKRYEDERFLPFLKKWVEFSSYFVYPNGHYGGTIGSRQTLHFYPHGYELLASEIPLAGAVADRMLKGLSDGALVPPEIQGERYFVYRMPEFLLAFLDYGKRPEALPALPYEREPFRRYFPGARITVRKTPDSYTVVNESKGGVVKHFQLPEGIARINNCGVIGRLRNGVIFTSQWVDEAHSTTEIDNGVAVEGRCHKVPSKLFSPWKFILFRLLVLLGGWRDNLAYYLKGGIRELLMTGNKSIPVRFERHIRWTGQGIDIATRIHLEENIQVEALQASDEFPARYVPQSRYFQPQELNFRGYILDRPDVDRLNRNRTLSVIERYRPGDRESVFIVED